MGTLIAVSHCQTLAPLRKGMPCAHKHSPPSVAYPRLKLLQHMRTVWIQKSLWWTYDLQGSWRHLGHYRQRRRVARRIPSSQQVLPDPAFAIIALVSSRTLWVLTLAVAASF